MKRARGPLLVDTEQAVAYVQRFLNVTSMTEDQIRKRIQNWAQEGKLVNVGNSSPGGARWVLKDLHNLVLQALDNMPNVRSSTKRRR